MRIEEARVVHFAQRVLGCESEMRHLAATCRYATNRKGSKKSIAFSYTAHLHSGRISHHLHMDPEGRTFSSPLRLHHQWGSPSINASRMEALWLASTIHPMCECQDRDARLTNNAGCVFAGLRGINPMYQSCALSDFCGIRMRYVNGQATSEPPTQVADGEDGGIGTNAR